VIRPFTCICMLLAAGSGLYLYQSKHQALMLDREIGKTLNAVDAARQRSSLLRAEYALLNDPSRLADLSAQFLPDMKTTTPGQFTSLADLDKRLPTIGLPPEPAAAPLEPDPAQSAPAAGVPIAEAQQPETPRAEAKADIPRPELQKPEAPRPAVIAAAPPRQAPPEQVAMTTPSRGIPVAARRVTTASRIAPTSLLPPPVTTREPVQPRPVVTQVVARVITPRPARVLPVAAAPAETASRITRIGQVEPRPMVGSALGMARMMAAPVAATYPVTSDYGYNR
jgi:hypothetical protein